MDLQQITAFTCFISNFSISSYGKIREFSLENTVFPSDRFVLKIDSQQEIDQEQLIKKLNAKGFYAQSDNKKPSTAILNSFNQKNNYSDLENVVKELLGNSFEIKVAPLNDVAINARINWTSQQYTY